MYCSFGNLCIAGYLLRTSTDNKDRNHLQMWSSLRENKGETGKKDEEVFEEEEMFEDEGVFEEEGMFEM